MTETVAADMQQLAKEHLGFGSKGDCGTGRRALRETLPGVART